MIPLCVPTNTTFIGILSIPISSADCVHNLKLLFNWMYIHIFHSHFLIDFASIKFIIMDKECAIFNECTSFCTRLFFSICFNQFGTLSGTPLGLMTTPVPTSSQPPYIVTSHYCSTIGTRIIVTICLFVVVVDDFIKRVRF